MNAWSARLTDAGIDLDAVKRELKAFNVETPSWGYAQTGTRFGKFLHPAAATTFEQKVEDAAEVHRLTRITPRLAVHVLWDLPGGFDKSVVKLLADHGLAIGAINPNVFQDQCYKYGSLASPDPAVRKRAIQHCLDSIEIGRQAGSDLLSLWFADGISFPGQDDLVRRKRAMAAGLAEIYAALPDSMTMLIEYKPFEPATYATDIPDWGLAALLARQCGPKAKVLVDTGHHLHGSNIEQIVAVLLDEGLLGGFHFNDRKYADDDLTAGSINPYQLFLIFDQIVGFSRDTEPRSGEGERAANSRSGYGKPPSPQPSPKGRGGSLDIAYMIDQSHNLKPKVEEMVQTVANLQQLYAKALLVDRVRLAKAQADCDLVAAEETLRNAFFADVSPLLAEVRRELGAAADPLAELRASGYVARRAAARKADRGSGSSYA